MLVWKNCVVTKQFASNNKVRCVIVTYLEKKKLKIKHVMSFCTFQEASVVDRRSVHSFFSLVNRTLDKQYVNF